MPSADSPLVYGYQYNDANQRIRVNLADGAYWLYRYDSLGQVISGKKYFQDNAPVPGQQFEYGFDDIGNRVSSKVGGDATGANLRSASYTRNLLNQYSTLTVGVPPAPSVLDIIGLAPASSAVTVNNLATDYRRGEYFQKTLTLANASAPVWTQVDTKAAGGTATSIKLLTPPATQSFSYDLDGNQIDDGVWSYVWDAENRLVSMQNLTTLATSTARVKMTFEYDHLGRRIRKKTFPWASTDYSPTASTDVRYVYDRWNLLASLPAASTTPNQTYLWGMDLSGSPQAAGGVGGLIAIKDSTQGQHFAVYDANGNVMGLVAAASSTVTAAYEYGPFGEVIRSSGLMAKLNPYRFSTKYQDNESDLLYYGYRYYSQSTGKWLSRDPVCEVGFRSFRNLSRFGRLNASINLYGFVNNKATSSYDFLGLLMADRWEEIEMQKYLHAIDIALSGLKARFNQICAINADDFALVDKVQSQLKREGSLGVSLGSNPYVDEWENSWISYILGMDALIDIMWAKNDKKEQCCIYVSAEFLRQLAFLQYLIDYPPNFVLAPQ